MPRWKIGELAQRTGLTVRTLHHYDHVGLLTPSERSEAGYRLYGPEDVRRLTAIVLLRGLGLSLDEIRACLAERSPELGALLERHALVLEQQVRREQELLGRLRTLAARCRQPDPPSIEELVEIVEKITMFEKHYSVEQQGQLAARAAQIGPERIRQVESEWKELFERFRQEMERGTDPAAEPVRELARRARALVGEFTGGDPGIARSLGAMYQQEGAAAVLEPHGFEVPAGVFEYMARAGEALAAAEPVS